MIREPHETHGLDAAAIMDAFREAVDALRWDPWQAEPRTPLPVPEADGHDEATWERISAAAQTYDPETDRRSVR